MITYLEDPVGSGKFPRYGFDLHGAFTVGSFHEGSRGKSPTTARSGVWIRRMRVG